MNNLDENLNLDSEQIEKKIKEDLAHLYNYPSIGKLFSNPDSNDLRNLCTKLNSTKERLDTIVRRGSNEESQKASKALEAIGLTLQFLQKLDDEQKQNKN